MIHLSNPVRLAVRHEFESQFNAQLALACAPLGLTPFTIDFTVPGKTFFDGPLELEDFLDYLKESPSAVPAMCLYGLGPVSDGHVITTFSGSVGMAGNVFLCFTPDVTDFESLSEAVQAAITGIIHESTTDDWGGGTYQNDLRITPSNLYFHNGKFYRTIQFLATFRVTAT